MAGGNVSARQKMINLMYLVFIAMMAMNMSKEVLSAFGLMEAKFAESNVTTTETNEALLNDLITKGDNALSLGNNTLALENFKKASKISFWIIDDSSGIWLNFERLKGNNLSILFSQNAFTYF